MKLDLTKPLCYRVLNNEYFLKLHELIIVESKRCKLCYSYYKNENNERVPLTFTDSGYIIDEGKRQHTPKIFNVNEDPIEIEELKRELEASKFLIKKLEGDLRLNLLKNSRLEHLERDKESFETKYNEALQEIDYLKNLNSIYQSVFSDNTRLNESYRDELSVLKSELEQSNQELENLNCQNFELRQHVHKVEYDIILHPLKNVWKILIGTFRLRIPD